MSLLPITEDTSSSEFEARIREWLRYEISVDIERQDVVNFLNSAVEVDRKELIQLFVDIMREEVPNEDEMPYLAYILTHNLDDDVLDVIVQIFDPEYYHMVSGLITSVNEEHIAIGIANIEKIFEGSELDRTALELLYSKAYEKGLVQLTDYITKELERDEDTYAVVPEWIIPGVRSHHDLVHSIVIPSPPKWRSVSPEEDAEYIASLVEEDQDIDDVYKQLVATLHGYTIAQREEMISVLIKQNSLMLLQKDPEIFRVMGPCLPMGQAYELRLKSRDPCNMYGGCRVYTCHENENINPDTTEAIVEDPVKTNQLADLEWFTGRCANEECKLLIRKKCHAVRLPVANEGGWLGCYCSFYCLRVIAADTSDVLTNMLAGFEGQYLANGIYDRDD